MSDVIIAFQHTVRVSKKGSGTNVKGIWTPTAASETDIQGVIVSPMSGSDESLNYYAGLKITEGQLVLYTITPLQGVAVIGGATVSVSLTLEDKILWRGKYYIITALIQIDQGCNVAGYVAEEVNPR